MAKKLKNVLTIIYKNIIFIIILIFYSIINMAKGFNKGSEDTVITRETVDRLKRDLQNYDNNLLALSNGSLTGKAKEDFLKMLRDNDLDPNLEVQEHLCYLQNKTQIDAEFKEDMKRLGYNI